ncbi:hypothetical protein [Actinosynnema sp. NPDC020468]|uniref:hypothetical protein n=1 Tax=Actinosynnema sp. NPDC020468 TaxID=3154488 RepID=UPI0033EB63E5
MFVGRTALLGLVDRTVGAVPRAGAPPVLVVEGCGGSGRSALLRRVHDTWCGATPAVLVRPREFRHAEDRAIRPVLAAVVLGLALNDVDELAFERVLLAQIAIATDTTGLTHADAVTRLEDRTQEHRDRAALIGLVEEIVTVAGTLAGNVGAPGSAEVAPAVARRVAERVVAALQRTRRFAWSPEARAWFGHQDQGLALHPEHARLQLGVQARSDAPAVRRGVDDVLIAAFLADLRHGLTDPGANALVLLDDGDVPSATAFTGALLRVRRTLADASTTVPPDPLALITTSGGALAAELADLPAPAHRPESAADGQAFGLWARVTSEDLKDTNVVQLARNHLWPDRLAAETVGLAVHKLTRGHPAATDAVLRGLRAEPDLVDDLGSLLDRAGLDRRLLLVFVRGTGADHDDDTLLHALITTSAARTRREARALAPLLPESLTTESALFSPTLWPAGRLHPLARYLGLRALAARAETGWRGVFALLRDEAPDDAGRLHHARLLGDRAEVAAELADRLPTSPTDEWLALFDAVVSTPDPRDRDVDAIRGGDQPGTTAGHLTRLLGVVPAIEDDPCVPHDVLRTRLYPHAGHGFRRLADTARDPAPLILRAQRYERHGRTRG